MANRIFQIRYANSGTKEVSRHAASLFLTRSLRSPLAGYADPRQSPNRQHESTHPAAKSIERLVRLTGRCVGFDMCCFHSKQPGLDSYLYAPDISEDALKSLHQAAGLAVTEGRYIAMSMLSSHPRYRDLDWVKPPLGIQAIFGHVIRNADHDVLGALTGFQRKSRLLSMEEMYDFRHFAELVRDELRLSTMATRDPLTGLYNRRAFDELLSSEWHRAKLIQAPVQLAIIDVDHFKKINDTFGHHRGDEILKLVSEKINKVEPRAGEVGSRLGGEEFALILPGCGPDHAHQILDRLRQDISTLWADASDQRKWPVTVSVGYSGVTPPTSKLDPDECLKLADRALFKAKQTGRNRVVAYKDHAA